MVPQVQYNFIGWLYCILFVHDQKINHQINKLESAETNWISYSGEQKTNIQMFNYFQFQLNIVHSNGNVRDPLAICILKCLVLNKKFLIRKPQHDCWYILLH